MHLTPLVLLAAVGISAHPSGHAHMHRQFHEKRDNLIVATIDGKVVSWTDGSSPFKQAHKPTPAVPTPEPVATTAAAVEAAPAPAETAAAAPAPAISDVATGIDAAVDTAAKFVAFPVCKKKRATAAQVEYKGNTGCAGYGSNIKLVPASVASKYKYTIKVVGSSQTQQCKVWMKIGPDGLIDGFFKGKEAKTFTLAAGATQHVAFDEDTQGAMCCYPGSIPLTSFGQFNCAWAEFDFGSAANGGWSGFDMSTIVSSAAGGPFPGGKLCDDTGLCSTVYQGGGGHNAFLGGMEKLDGIGGNKPAGKLALTLDTGFTH